MAVTWAPSLIVEGVAANGKRVKRCILTATGTYTTGGDAFSPALVGLKGITDGYFRGDDSGFIPAGFTVYVKGTPEAPLLKANIAATGGSGAVAEVAGGTSLTGKIFSAYLEGY